MSSPFTFFRQNQTMFMAAIVILSMVAFTLSDLFDQQQGANFLLLGVMVGGIVFAFSGLNNGRWMQYGIAGAVVGGLCGWLLPNVISPANEAVMTSKLGAFTNKRVSELIQKRSLANQFLSVAFDKAFGAGLRQFYQPPQFGYFPQNIQDDMAFGELLRAEADELGIVVTDGMVSDYINDATMQRLTAKDFAEARKSLMLANGASATEDEVFDALRHEIKAQMAYRQLNPYFATMPQSPELYYEMFRRMKVTQRLNIVRLDVDSFVSKVEDPSDSEVATFFAEHQKKYPGMDAPGSPGFRQLPKAKLAYAELNYKDVEAETTPPTDAEIEAYYNENKDKLYTKPTLPAEETKKEDTTAGTSTEDGSKPAEGSAPADPAAPESSEPTTPTPEAPKTETPAADAPKAEEAKTPESAAPAPELPKTEEPKADETKPETPGEECSPFAQEPEQPKSETPAETPAAQDPPAADANATTPAAAEPQAADPNASPTPADAAKPAEATPTTPEGEKPAEPAKTDETPATTTDPAAPPEFVIPVVEYLPLDETLKGDIRDQLLDERVRKEIDLRMNAVGSALKAIEKERSAKRRKIVAADPDIESSALYEQMRDNNADMLKGMKAAAETNKCKFVETRLTTFQELAEGETYRVGAATEPASGPFGAAGSSVAQQAANLFPQEITNDTNLFQQRRAVRNAGDFDGNESHYVWWIVEFSEPHVPSLDDDGIREQVVLQWKRIKARELARKRAESMVTLVKDDLAKPEAERKGFPVVLEGQTITGETDATLAAVRQTQTFSWIEQSMTPSMNFQQRRQLSLSSVPYADEAAGTVRGAGNEFMTTVFEELGADQPGIAMSEDQLIVYVVQPVDRSADEEVLRQQFLTEGKQLSSPTGSGVSELASDMIGGAIRSEWTQALWDKYGFDRGIDLSE